MGQHSRLSPSGAHRWTRCPGSVVLEARYPDTSSRYADEGTAAHEVAALCLKEGKGAAAYVGRMIDVDDGTIEVREEWVEPIDRYVDAVRQAAEGAAHFGIEERFDISRAVGEEMSGTADAVIVRGDGELQVHDFKFGMGVEVEAEDNEQLQLYALGAWLHYSFALEIDQIRMAIHQPRKCDVPKEWTCTKEELTDFSMRTLEAANEVRRVVRFAENGGDIIDDLKPGEKQCRFCRAKAECPALRDEVRETIFGRDDTATPEDFENLSALVEPTAFAADWLSASMSKLDLIESWIKGVRAEVERRLVEGTPVPGFKLVEGRRGNRDWRSDVEAEDVLRKRFRLTKEEAYSFKVISPTQAEDLLAKKSPQRWATLQPMIVRSDGKPSVAPESDKRPAIDVRVKAEDFEVIPPVADHSDLI